MSVTEDAPEPWIATGYHCYVAKKGTRAVYFAHRACMLQVMNSQIYWHGFSIGRFNIDLIYCERFIFV